MAESGMQWRMWFVSMKKSECQRTSTEPQLRLGVSDAPTLRVAGLGFGANNFDSYIYVTLAWPVEQIAYRVNPSCAN